MQNRAALAAIFVDVSRSQLDDSTPAGLLVTVGEPCMRAVSAGAAAVVHCDNGEVGVCASTPEVAALYERATDPAIRDLDALITPGKVVTVRLDELPLSCAGFAGGAADLGFAGLHVVPMPPTTEGVKGFHLFSSDASGLDADTEATTLAIVDVATTSLSRQRSLAHAESLAAQLQAALDSRIVIEQAKGIVAERHGVTVELAFEALRSYARSHNARIAEVSRSTIAGETDLGSCSSLRSGVGARREPGSTMSPSL